MKKILIVDDNENNRMLLRAILEDYAEENNTSLDIHEAVNGLEAALVCEVDHFALIFMDIMMPEMDGIEATKRIRQCDAKAMIIAVSAVDDGERQRQILSSGAEDYISKPINANIFHARLSNYLALIASREHKHFYNEAGNLFSQEIYSRQLLFFIRNDDDLAEFWEYYLLNSGMGCELLSDTVRTLYALGSIAVRLGLQIRIFVEESDDNSYFTMDGLDELDGKMIKLVLAKNPSLQDYKISESKFSIRFPRIGCIENEMAAPAEKTDTAPVSSAPELSADQKFETAQLNIVSSAQLQVFDYMDEEDLVDIKGYISKLDSLLLLVGSGDIHHDEVTEIATNLTRIGKIATIYSDSFAIGHALADLSETIQSHSSQFIEKSTSLGALCAAFSRDLMSWIRMTFEEGAPSVNFMNDTITSNAQMIGSMLSMDDAAHENGADLDDIFDF